MQIRLINLNTTASMTHKIEQAARRVAAAGTRISASNPRSGPVSIESHFDEAISALATRTAWAPSCSAAAAWRT